MTAAVGALQCSTVDSTSFLQQTRGLAFALTGSCTLHVVLILPTSPRAAAAAGPSYSGFCLRSMVQGVMPRSTPPSTKL
jgi:hypothetical protein